MARRILVFDEPDRFVAGTVGDPGARTFFLQARKGDAVASVVLEKAQVAVLADRLAELLAAIGAGEPGSAPGSAAERAHDDRPLDEPLVDLFRVGTMTLGWDAAAARVVIEAQAQGGADEPAEVEDEAAEGPDLVRARLSLDQAREFVRRSAALVAAGRPACPFCGQPLEPTGHFCTQTNAHLN